jgi:hypothetical protein
VAPGVSRNGAESGRPLRMRPHWWAVLAVSLSLLALVAAATAGHPDGRVHHGQEAVASGDGQTGRRPDPTTTTTTTTVLQPDLGFAPVTSTTLTPTTSPPGAPFTVSTKGPVATEPSSNVPSAPTTTTTAPSAAAATSGTTPVQPQTFPGDLQYPDAAMAVIPFTGSGSMRITATWTPMTALSISATCPGGSGSNEGPSGISVVIPDADGSCDIVLKETVVQWDDVSYTVTVVPSGA